MQGKQGLNGKSAKPFKLETRNPKPETFDGYGYQTPWPSNPKAPVPFLGEH